MKLFKSKKVRGYLESMIGAYVTSSQEKARSAAQEKVEAHVQEVSNRVEPLKLEKITALYVKTTENPSVLGWKRYCMLHGSLPVEELDKRGS